VHYIRILTRDQINQDSLCGEEIFDTLLHPSRQQGNKGRLPSESRVELGLNGSRHDDLRICCIAAST
jgi:hypothetical protein